MALLEINWKPSRKELRQFAAIWFPLACAVICWLLYKATKSWHAPAVFSGIAAILCVLANFSLEFSHRLYVAWMVAAFPIGWTVSHLLMGLIYYLLITPMGLLMRLCGRDSMGRRFDPARDSYWVPHSTPKDKQQYFRQY
jgi:hypothetical protein